MVPICQNLDKYRQKKGSSRSSQLADPQHQTVTSCFGLLSVHHFSPLCFHDKYVVMLEDHMFNTKCRHPIIVLYLPFLYYCFFTTYFPDFYPFLNAKDEAPILLAPL